MKRGLTILLLLIPIVLIAAYNLIPRTQPFVFSSLQASSDEGAIRQMQNKDQWVRWWPGTKENENNYSYKAYHYRIDKIMLDGFEATMYDEKDSLKAGMQVLPVGTDSAEFQLLCRYNFSSNPFTRFGQYFKLREMQKNLSDLLTAIKPYFDKVENIYGMKVEQQKVKDSSLVSIRKPFNHYPTTEEVYAMIQSIKTYISKKGGEETNAPMLNVYQLAPSNYEAMVAIPTKADIPTEGDFILKKMVLGNILVGEVKGGPGTIANREKDLAFYVTDHSKLSPAISFQSLVTDRSKEADTSKWITKLYYPVFY